jgi:hypothetical protein
MHVGLTVAKPYDPVDEVGGEVGPSPYLTVEATEDSFPSAEKAKVRVTWHNPTKFGLTLEQCRPGGMVILGTAEPRLSPREERENIEPITLEDFAWCSVEVAPPGGLAPRPEKYRTVLERMFEAHVGFGSFLYGPKGVGSGATNACEMPLSAYVHPSAIGPGQHVLDYSARFSFYYHYDPESRLRWATSKGIIRFTIKPEK